MHGEAIGVAASLIKQQLNKTLEELGCTSGLQFATLRFLSELGIPFLLTSKSFNFHPFIFSTQSQTMMKIQKQRTKSELSK